MAKQLLHIIRDRDAMDKIHQYIINNPVSWDLDRLHPDNPSKWEIKPCKSDRHQI
jgi:hypothetical protein